MKALIGTPIRADRLEALRTSYPQVEFLTVQSRDEIPPLIGDVEILFGSVARDTFDAARRLRWIQSYGAGVEWMDRVPELVESDVLVTNTRGAHADTIGEHAFALLLTFTRAIRYYDSLKARHVWGSMSGDGKLRGVAGATLGIVGFGNIGRALAERAAAFKMKVRAVDVRPADPPPYVESIWPLDRLHDLLRLGDVLAVTVPLTAASRGMIGPTEVGLLKKGAIVLTLSRGGIVDEAAVARAVREGHLAGAAFDVVATEPLPPDSPLWDVENVIITSHVAPVSDLTYDLVWSIFHENVGRCLRGEPLVNVVDKKAGF